MDDIKRPRHVEPGEEEKGLPGAKRHCPDSASVLDAGKTTSYQESPNEQYDDKNQLAYLPTSDQSHVAEPSPPEQFTFQQVSKSQYVEEIINGQGNSDNDLTATEGSHNSKFINIEQERSAKEAEGVVSPDGNSYGVQELLESQSNPTQQPLMQETCIPKQDEALSKQEGDSPKQEDDVSKQEEDLSKQGDNVLKQEGDVSKQKLGGGNHDEDMVMADGSFNSKPASQLPMNKVEKSEFQFYGENHHETTVVGQGSLKTQIDTEMDTEFETEIVIASNISVEESKTPEFRYTEDLSTESSIVPQSTTESKPDLPQSALVEEAEGQELRPDKENAATTRETTQNLTLEQDKAPNLKTEAKFQGDESNATERSSVDVPSSMKSATEKEPRTQVEGEDQVESPAQAQVFEVESIFPEQADSSDAPIGDTLSQLGAQGLDMKLSFSSLDNDDSMGLNFHKREEFSSVIGDEMTGVEGNDKKITGIPKIVEELVVNYPGDSVSTALYVPSFSKQAESPGTFDKSHRCNGGTPTTKDGGSYMNGLDTGYSCEPFKYTRPTGSVEPIKLFLSSPETSIYNIPLGQLIEESKDHTKTRCENAPTRPLNKEMQEILKGGTELKDLAADGGTRDSSVTRLTDKTEKQLNTEAKSTSQEHVRMPTKIQHGAKISDIDLRNFNASIGRLAGISQKLKLADSYGDEEPKGSVKNLIVAEESDFTAYKDEGLIPIMKSLPEPCRPTKFPRYAANNASVYIVLSHTNEDFQFKLHKTKLASMSEYFKYSLQEEVLEHDQELVDQQLGGLKSPARYELICETESDEWKLVRMPFTILVPNENKKKLRSDQNPPEAPLSVLRRFSNLLCLAHGVSISLSDERGAKEIDYIRLARLATKHGAKCLDAAGIAVRKAYGRPKQQDFLNRTKRIPFLMLEFAEIIQCGSLYREAMIHSIGKWNPKWEMEQSSLSLATWTLINSKLESLEQKKMQVNNALFASGIAFDGTPVGLDPTDKSMYDAFIIQSLWLEFFKANLRQIPSFHLGGFYRLLAKGGDAYLKTESVERQLNHFRGQDFGYWDEVGENLAVMKNYAAKVVQELVVNNSAYDVEEDGITWLTCTEINDEELPWI